MRVRITEVSPRDGLQNEPRVIPTSDKIALVRNLLEAGVDEIEVTSFVSPRSIPQLADGEEVVAALGNTVMPPGAPVLSALVPNERGLERMREAHARAGRRVIGKVAVFTAASETFTKRNIGASIAESIRRFEPVVAGAHEERLVVRGYISCVVRCPFEGRVRPERVAHVAQALWDLGVDEVDLGDTVGAAEEGDVTLLVNALTSLLGDEVVERLTLHLHDTYGRASSCVREALQLGVRSFDGAVAGLGGCPYASTPQQRAPGNIDTETLVRIVHDAGHETGVRTDRLHAAAACAARIIGERGRGDG